ncbi:MAG: ABC transporter permease subunit [Chloroflexi bacterium]|nr:ABC transporter permease subunit [Chloroflexota bacterium]
MLRNVFLKTVRDQSRALLFWGFGLVGLSLYATLFYPTIRDMPELNKLVEGLPEALKVMFLGEMGDFTSPVGYLNTELFFLWMPILFLVFTIGFGSGAIAGEEERGTLDLLLSHPLPRWRVVAEKFSAMVVASLALAFALWVGLAIGVTAVNMDISLGRVAEATLSGSLLGLVFGMVTLALGCATGNRGLSIGGAGALAVAAYILNSFARLTEVLKPYRKLSPFYYHVTSDPLANGLNLGDAGVLMGLIVALLVVALITFQRRDLAV